MNEVIRINTNAAILVGGVTSYFIISRNVECALRFNI